MKSFKQRLFLLNCIALDKGWMTEEQFAASRPKGIVGEVEIVYREKWVKARVGHFEINYRNDVHRLKKKWVDYNLRNVPKAIRKALGEHDVFKTLLLSQWRCITTKPVCTLPVFRENYERRIDLVGRAMVATGCDEKGKLNGTFKFNVPDLKSAYIVVDRSLVDGACYATIYVLPRKF